MTIDFNGKKPTGTTNYILSRFNIVTKERTIFGEGGVPLHKIVDELHDFIYSYINLGIEKNIYYMHVILKPDGDSRPETPYLIKLNGKKLLIDRKKEFLIKSKEFIKNIDEIFSEFISSDYFSGRLKKSYRTDVNPSQLVSSYNRWNKVIKPGLNSIRL